MSNFYSNPSLHTSVSSSLDSKTCDGFSIALFIQIAQDISTENCSEKLDADNCASFPLTASCQQSSDSIIDSSTFEQREQQNDEMEKSTEIEIEIEENEDDSSLVDTNTEDLDNDYFAVKKSNIMKNILKSFQRFIESEKDQERQKELCRLANKTYNYSQLKKLINRNLKAYGRRWNMKAKHMIEKSSFNMLLKYFLENISTIWLEKSKVQNKDEHLFVVNFMLQAIENPVFSQKIHFYQKKKCILK